MEETKKKEDDNGSPSADEKLGGNEDSSGPSDSSPSPAAGYFDTLFPIPRPLANESPRFDIHSTSSENGTDDQFGMPQENDAGKVTQSSPTRGGTADKDDKSLYANGPQESPYFGSSVNYGAREYYGSESKKSYKNEDDEFSNKNIANRGEWWQGSLYY